MKYPIGGKIKYIVTPLNKKHKKIQKNKRETIAISINSPIASIFNMKKITTPPNKGDKTKNPQKNFFFHLVRSHIKSYRNKAFNFI